MLTAISRSLGVAESASAVNNPASAMIDLLASVAIITAASRTPSCLESSRATSIRLTES